MGTKDRRERKSLALDSPRLVRGAMQRDSAMETEAERGAHTVTSARVHFPLHLLAAVPRAAAEPPWPPRAG